MNPNTIRYVGIALMIVIFAIIVLRRSRKKKA